jgi:hypothetical protein
MANGHLRLNAHAGLLKPLGDRTDISFGAVLKFLEDRGGAGQEGG